MTNEADKAKANYANEAEAYEGDEAIVVDVANKANVTDEIIAANINIQVS